MPFFTSLSFFLLFYFILAPSAHALKTSNALVTDVGSYVDKTGIRYVVGTVENKNDVPIHVLLGLNTTTNNVKTTSVAQPYGKTIYAYGEDPFKFKIPRGSDVKLTGNPYVYQLSTTSIPYFDALRLNYSNIPLPNGTLIGTVKNIASFDIYNLSIYASAHDKTGAQIDSVTTPLMPILKSGEKASFSVSPNPVLGSKVAFYSCFGVDFKTTNMKINIGQNRYIISNMTSLATIENIKADPSSGTIKIYMNNQYPVPGPLILKIPQLTGASTIFVTMDGTLYRDAVATSKGFALVDLNVPGGKHEIDVNGIR
jgi:hypothetical protein